MNDHPIHSFIQSFWSYEKKMFDQVNTVYGQIYGSFIHQERLSFKFDCIFDGLFSDLYPCLAGRMKQENQKKIRVYRSL